MATIPVNEQPDNYKNPLWEDILKFSKNKVTLAVILVLIGITGIIIPVVPGLLLFVLAIALFKKGWMEKLRTRFRLWKTKK